MFLIFVTQRMVLGPAALASQGSLFNMQSLGPTPALLDQTVVQSNQVAQVIVQYCPCQSIPHSIYEVVFQNTDFVMEVSL